MTISIPEAKHFVWQCQISGLINFVYRNPSKQVLGLRRIPSQIAPQCYSQHNLALACIALPELLCSSSCHCKTACNWACDNEYVYMHIKLTSAL